MVIDKFFYVIVSFFLSYLFDYFICVFYCKVELVKNFSEMEYVVFWECLKFCGLEKDIEFYNVVDLLVFIGLGFFFVFMVFLF